MYNIIKMFTTKFGLLFFCLLLKDLLSAKKLEEIFTCINETECDELIQKDMSEKSSSSTTENIYNMSSSANNSIYPTQTTKIKTMPDTQTPYRIKYNSELRNQSIQRVLTTICECDLTLSSCDINCCCDKDCNDFHLSAFSHCENYQAELFDKRYCYNRNFIQRNNTPFILEKLANNLFCILYDNLPPTYSVNNDLDIKTEHDLKEAITLHRQKWKWKDLLRVPEYNISSHYQDDDIVWALHNNRIQPFEMLKSGFTELCSFKKTVKYLREWKNQCLQAELNATNKFLFPATFNNFTIIASLYLLNETDTEVLDQVCPRNVCLTLTTYYCKHPWKECNNSTVLGSCTNGVCYNIVKGVKYVIIHNGSMGINSVDVYFSMGNVSSSFYQHFEVSYEWADFDKERSFSLSGNPGYIIGKPIIIGIIKLNKTNNVDTKYISFNKTNSFLTLPVATQSGECNKIDRYTLGFGEDVKLKCSIFINTNNFSTESCVALQNLTMQFLMGDTLFNVTQTDQYGIYVSRSGNFSTNDTANWTQILLDRIPQSVIIGESVNGRLRCSGLITSIHIYVLYSVLAKPETLTNHNVLGVGLAFSVESNITWPKCSLENCIDTLVLDVTSYVTFYDVSKPSRYFFVGGPNLDVTLPYDFFYPFLSNSICIKSNIFFITVALSVTLHKFY